MLLQVANNIMRRLAAVGRIGRSVGTRLVQIVLSLPEPMFLLLCASAKLNHPVFLGRLKMELVPPLKVDEMKALEKKAGRSR